MLLDLLRERRSIRQFLDTPVEQEKLDLLIEAMLRSPSSRGLNPWEFVVVTDKKILRDLSSAKPHGASFVQHAPLAIVVCADPSKSDVWVEDCSIAAIDVQLLATDLGLGSCWGQIRNRPHDDSTSAEAYIQQLLGIPRHLRVGMIVAVGYPAEDKKPVPFEKLDRRKIHVNHYH